MNGSKAFYESKTVWASIVTMVLSVVLALRLTHIGPVDTEQLAQQQGNLVDLLTQLGVLVSGFVALYGRLTAQSTLTARKEPNGQPPDNSGDRP